MATSYPGGYDSLPRPTASDTMDDTAGGLDGPAVIDNISDAIEAIEAELGLDPAGNYSTVAARLGATLYAPPATGTAATDTANVQAVIDAAQGTTTSSGITGRTIVFPPGEYVLNDTIDLIRWQGRLVGQGWGNSPAYSTNPGNATVFRWAGNNTSPMFLVEDSSGAAFENMRLEGDETNPPTYGIQMNEPAGGSGHGTNSYTVLRDMHIGQYTWSSQGTTKGTMGAAVGYTGDNTNNDKFHIENVRLRGCGYGLYIANQQSTWGFLNNVWFGYNTTAAISTAASLTATNLRFQYNEIDIKQTNVNQVNVFGWWSENAAMIFDLYSGSSLHVRGGKWQIMSPMSGETYMNTVNSGVADDVTLESLEILYSITPHPKLDLHGTYAVEPYVVRLASIRDWDPADDLYMRGYAGKCYADIHTNGYHLETLMGSTSKDWTFYVAPNEQIGNYTLIDGESNPLIVTAGATRTVTLPDATTCRPGRTRFTIKSNLSAGVVTISPGTENIDGAATLDLAAQESVTVTTNGTDWFTV